MSSCRERIAPDDRNQASARTRRPDDRFSKEVGAGYDEPHDSSGLDGPGRHVDPSEPPGGAPLAHESSALEPLTLSPFTLDPFALDRGMGEELASHSALSFGGKPGALHGGSAGRSPRATR